MDFTQLPFEADVMLEGLRPWIRCESLTYDSAALDRMMDLAAHDFATAGATIERIPGRLGLGGSLRARFPHVKPGEPGILVSGHLDTVHLSEPCRLCHSRSKATVVMAPEFST